jgi:hypothetical protein
MRELSYLTLLFHLLMLYSDRDISKDYPSSRVERQDNHENLRQIVGSLPEIPTVNVPDVRQVLASHQPDREGGVKLTVTPSIYLNEGQLYL